MVNEQEQIKVVEAELLEKVEEISGLAFKVSNLTTERDTANQEIERLTTLHVNQADVIHRQRMEIERLKETKTIVVQDGPLVAAYEQQGKEIERLKRENMCDVCTGTGKRINVPATPCVCSGTGLASRAFEGMREEFLKLNSSTSNLESQLTVERGKMEKLRDALSNLI